MARRLHIEKRIDDYPRWYPLVVTIGAVLAAVLLSGIIFRLIGGEPLKALSFFWKATFGSWATFSDTLVKATPLILVGAGLYDCVSDAAVEYRG